MDEALTLARRSAEVTHDHPEGIRGAQAVAAVIFLARHGASRLEILTEIEQRFDYDLAPRLDDIRPGYRFDVTCRGSVPQAIIASTEPFPGPDAGWFAWPASGRPSPHDRCGFASRPRQRLSPASIGTRNLRPFHQTPVIQPEAIFANVK
ncbi:ADP-ribosylglycohydrolase family protein [Halomonas sp. SSL-5]|uniref:ADP-ribosylglycohydrolase family protein n=1 Tax=Halomonas sp. SSL-5 TaxID=3065855 RepID=UPI00273A1DAB|nr:ADP-ribosylglycohydrolase family protein [Halomonas sp. SSL-5]MDY7116900.1 ADP-ribosylglycohydrolase family protein [Halomonas sp. SSL-5]